MTATLPTDRDRSSGGFRQAGIRVPAWAIGALLATAAIFGVGLRLGAQVTDNDSRFKRLEERASSLDFRLCRIERALGISPYQSCYPNGPEAEPARAP
jgi:hypothetical protein